MAKYENAVKQPGNLSPRVKWLRDYYFEGTKGNGITNIPAIPPAHHGTFSLIQLTYFIVPEMYTYMYPFTASFRSFSEVIPVPDDFWNKSIVERKAIFTKKAVCEKLPIEILPGDLLCGAKFNMMYSMCLTKEEQKDVTSWLKQPKRSCILSTSMVMATPVQHQDMSFQIMQKFLSMDSRVNMNTLRGFITSSPSRIKRVKKALS
jgi:hypothetical protein